MLSFKPTFSLSSFTFIKRLFSSSVSMLFSQLVPPSPSPWASLEAQMVKRLPTMQETQVRSLGWEDSPWTAALLASQSITNSWSLLRLMSIKLVMPSNHLILCHPFLPLSVFPSSGVFSHESALCIRWPKYWTFSFSISPSN